VSLEGLADEWAAEKRPTQKTLYEWRRVLRQLKAYLGHDDAAQIKSSDLNAWKASLVAAGLRAKTIGDAKLAPVRAILQWAVDNDRLLTNPASRVVIDVKSKPSESIRSFSEDEAAVVLKAARSERKAALRWVPWLCAYTGARVAEICQLRAEDVLQIDGVWCLRITPEAGPLKTSSSERAIPIHSAVIDEGFLDFAREAGSGPLFPQLKPDKFGSRGGNGTKIIGRWVRSLGIADLRISPSHSWRHRLKTLARRHGLATDIVDAIVGHRRKTVADGYGEFPMEALHRELTKIPVLKLN
jgi:integrase